MNFRDIILKHNKSVLNSREEADVSASLGKHTFNIPVMCSNMKSVLTPEICKMFDSNNIFYVYHRINGVEDVIKFTRFANKSFNVVSISVGVTQEWVNLVLLLRQLKLKVDYFTVDVALSYNDNIIPILETIKKEYPDCFLIVGNGSTPEWVTWLGKLGMVDAFKMNIGVSSSCQTRQFTGFSNPTVTALIECSSANASLRNPMVVISDGGLTVENGVVWIGDIAKALIFGADWVMSGALYSRCIDSPAILNGYFGNASSQSKGELKRVEGTLVKVESNGLTVSEMITRIKESLQSSVSYSGGRNLKEMVEMTEFYLELNDFEALMSYLQNRTIIATNSFVNKITEVNRYASQTGKT